MAAGARPGANIATGAEIRRHKREKSTQLLFETYGLADDQNLSKDATGKYVCILCRSKHLTEMSYVRHRDGRKHRKKMVAGTGTEAPIPKHTVRNILVGEQRGYSVEMDFSEAREMPSYRFVSSLEQAVEELNEDAMYLVFICEPHRTVGFKLEAGSRTVVHESLEEETGMYTLHFV